jgi:hypothetical protein
MTQSRASAKAVSARRRSSTDNEEWETYVCVPNPRRATASPSTVLLESANTRRFSPRWMPLTTFAALPTFPDVVQSQFGCCRRRSRWRDDGARPRALSPLEPLEQHIRVADGGGQTDPLERAPGQRAQPIEHGEKVPAAVVAREGVHLVDDDGPQVTRTCDGASSSVESSIASSDSGVDEQHRAAATWPVAGGCLQRCRRGARWPAGRASPADVASRGSRLLRSARIGTTYSTDTPRPLIVIHLRGAAASRPRSCRPPWGRRTTQSSPSNRPRTIDAVCSGRSRWPARASSRRGAARPGCSRSKDRLPVARQASSDRSRSMSSSPERPRATRSSSGQLVDVDGDGVVLRSGRSPRTGRPGRERRRRASKEDPGCHADPATEPCRRPRSRGPTYAVIDRRVTRSWRSRRSRWSRGRGPSHRPRRERSLVEAGQAHLHVARVVEAWRLAKSVASRCASGARRCDAVRPVVERRCAR